MDNGLFEVVRLFEGKKWGCGDGLGEMFVFVNDMLKALEVASEDTKISLKAPAISSLASLYSGVYPIRLWRLVYLNVSQEPQYHLLFYLNMTQTIYTPSPDSSCTKSFSLVNIDAKYSFNNLPISSGSMPSPVLEWANPLPGYPLALYICLKHLEIFFHPAAKEFL